MEEKKDLRRWARSLAPATSDESARVSANARSLLELNQWKKVLIFLPMPGEVALTPLIGSGPWEFFLTRTPPAGPLTVHLLSTDLETHSFGYRQPPPTAPTVDPSTLDVALVPGVLFDRHGGRLGHGKGYYDTLLRGQSMYRIGVTLARRVIEQVPTTVDDVRMDALVTELGVTTELGRSQPPNL